MGWVKKNFFFFFFHPWLRQFEPLKPLLEVIKSIQSYTPNHSPKQLTS